MKNISWFAGVGGFDLGFERAGIVTVGQCEIDRYCNDVLARHWPGAERLRDVRKISFRTGKGWKRYKRFSARDADVFTAGIPCQDVSVAGKRAGLAGSRTGLWFDFHRIITEYQPPWVVLENVPGLLSSNSGKDFAVIIGGLTGLIPEVPKNGWGNAGFARGAFYSVAWRILDAQYFGVAQRRRRVFIVGYLGGGSNPIKVLFEPESCERHTPPSREAGQEIAGTIGNRIARSRTELDGHGAYIYQWASGGKDGAGANGQVDKLVGFQETGYGYWQQHQQAQCLRTPDGGGSGLANVVARCLTAREGNRQDGESVNLIPEIGDAISIVEQNNVASTPDKISLRSNPAQPIIAWQKTGDRNNPNISTYDNIHPSISANPMSDRIPFVGVRRLTPLECERLQGFPDGWTEGQSDTQRYKQLGNAVCVNVAEWIGRRIMEVHNGTNPE